ncbi:LysE family transporter [Bdellovibrio sp. 22V]|uniref:LysE/ArgO family amino acid transporter n=1 Tax=Bdellovibrio sp. 22V TaxID=3044166 RepID=UPI002543C4B5|nr:LysE family transporter [Bdellovibrio sp. 22V]WII70809.1 LysE family transporter [Bdellovibrio sp. 22V]
MGSIFIEGLLLQGSLIFALGAQNIFVMESGLRRARPALVAALCTLSDLLLIFLGVLGAATIFLQFPLIKILFGILGVLFLVYYGIQKLREEVNPLDLASHEKTSLPGERKKIILQALAFSLLNPHVYLDTVVLIGGVSSKFPEISNRLIFGLGAGSFSCVWCFSLAFGATRLRPLLMDHRRFRVVMMAAGVLLILIAIQLAFTVWEWVFRGP